MRTRIAIVADLLMAAAYADQHLDGNELTVVRQQLRRLLGVDNLPMDLDFRLGDFDSKTFDRRAATLAFAGDSLAVKRHLLELLASVHAADGEFDLAEDAFIQAVARDLEMPDASYRDLVVSVEVTELPS